MNSGETLEEVTPRGSIVIACVFPEPDNAISLGDIIERAQNVFKGRPEVAIKMTRGDAAETIKFFLQNGELPVEDAEESNLIQHAREELKRAGNDEAFNKSILDAIKGFSTFGHSGGSASIAIPMLNALLNYKNLTPLTDDPKEWNNVSDQAGSELWQSRRCADAFSHDGGKTHYFLDENEDSQNPKNIHTSVTHS